MSRDEKILHLAHGLMRGAVEMAQTEAGFPDPLVVAQAMQHAVNTIIGNLLLHAELARYVRDLPWIIDGQPTPQAMACFVTLTFPGRPQ